MRSWTPWGYSASLQGGVRIKRPLYALAPLVAASAYRACNRVASLGSIGLVHVHWVVPNGPIAAAFARRHGIPLVVSLHGSDISVAQRSAPFGRAARWTFAHASAVTAPSEDLLERARALGAKGDVRLVPYGVDQTAFRPDEAAGRSLRERIGLAVDDVVVLAVGRFIPVKGFEYLIDAVARARQATPGLKLVLVGGGDLADELETKVRDLDLARETIFAGMVSPADVSHYLAAADIVAVPSVRHEGYVDGLPNVALEAMSSGKPLVASRIGGLPQVVDDGRTGILVPERDPQQLAEAITRLASDPMLRRGMGDAARTRVESDLTWPATAHRVEEIYRSVLERV